MLTIRTHDSFLSQLCDPVTSFDDELRTLVDQMAEEMYANNGVGLAAPQVGIARKIALVDHTSGDDATQLLVLINPVITWRDEIVDLAEEGCLSYPGIIVPVQRSVRCDVEYNDVIGQKKRRRLVDLRARIAQHEIDHLNGITMFDRLNQYDKRDVRLEMLERLASV